jgi:beta-galactosidase GanA
MCALASSPGRGSSLAGAYEFDWLRRAIDTLHQAGLKVVLGTPTATPPKWLVDEMPDMLPVGTDGSPSQIRLAPAL